MAFCTSSTKGQFLILHLQRPYRLHGGHLVLGNHSRHLVAVVTDMAVQQQPVRHILMGRIRGPGMARRWEGNVRYVEAGEDLYHARNGLCRGSVDGLHVAVGNGGVADLGHQGLPATEVVRVLGAAGGLFIGVHPDDALADTVAHRISSFFNGKFQPGR